MISSSGYMNERKKSPNTQARERRNFAGGDLVRSEALRRRELP